MFILFRPFKWLWDKISNALFNRSAAKRVQQLQQDLREDLRSTVEEAKKIDERSKETQRKIRDLNSIIDEFKEQLQLLEEQRDLREDKASKDACSDLIIKLHSTISAYENERDGLETQDLKYCKDKANTISFEVLQEKAKRIQTELAELEQQLKANPGASKRLQKRIDTLIRLLGAVNDLANATTLHDTSCVEAGMSPRYQHGLSPVVETLFEGLKSPRRKLSDTDLLTSNIGEEKAQINYRIHKKNLLTNISQYLTSFANLDVSRPRPEGEVALRATIMTLAQALQQYLNSNEQTLEDELGVCSGRNMKQIDPKEKKLLTPLNKILNGATPSPSALEHSNMVTGMRKFKSIMEGKVNASVSFAAASEPCIRRGRTAASQSTLFEAKSFSSQRRRAGSKKKSVQRDSSSRLSPRGLQAVQENFSNYRNQ